MRNWSLTGFLLILLLSNVLFAQDSMYVEVRFSEPLALSTVTNISNYIIQDMTNNSFVQVRGVAVQYIKGGHMVNQDLSKIDTLVLITGPHFTQGYYTVCVDSVRDLAGNYINSNARCAQYWVETPLPVELEYFTATLKKNTVTLKWRTATEVNNYGWDIERAAGVPQNFIKIGFVAGAGNSNRPRNYSFTNKLNISGMYYYRLKQIDTNGTYAYSPIVSVNFLGNAGMQSNFVIYPNPSNPTATIEYGVQTSGSVKIEMFDATGQYVTTLVDEYQDMGVYKITLHSANYSSGVYLLRIITKEYTEVKKTVLLK